MKALYVPLILLLLVLLDTGATSATVVFNHPAPQSSAEFGTSLAFVRDITGDGVSEVLIGVPKQDVGANVNDGQVYLLNGATGALILTLSNPVSKANAKFGAAVAAIDITGDGTDELLIGASNQDVGTCIIGNSSGCSIGQVFVFKTDGTLLQILDHPALLAGAFFGSAIAAGDVDGDLIPDIIVGAPGQNNGVYVPGQVFVFSGAGFGLLSTLNDPNNRESEIGLTFGTVVAVIGDVNGDGKADVLVGDAQQDAGANVDQGQVHIFSGATGALIRTIGHPEPQARSFFGGSAAGIADVDGDGIKDILVGSGRHDVGANLDQGRAYVFSGGTGTLVRIVNDPMPQFAGYFGYSVAGTGDFNGDVIPDLLVGAPGKTANGNPGQGQAFIFNAVNGSLLFTLDNPIPQRDSNFGRSVASGGDLDLDGKFDPLVASPLQNVGGNSLQGIIGGFKSTEIIGGGGNQAPVADAGPDQTVNEGGLTNLNGTASSDPNGDPITYSWTQTAGPSVTLSNPTSATPTFTAPLVTANTVLTFQLIVNDGSLNSAPDTVNVTVLDVTVNQAPLANAGPDQTVNEGVVVTLNGSGSSDPDGDPITYSWTQTAGPSVVLSNPNVANPTFTAPLVTATTVLTFQLIVNDGQVNSAPDTVSITVLDVPPPPSGCNVDFMGTFSKLTRKTSKGNDTLSFTLGIFNAGTVQSQGSFKVKFYLSTDTTLGSGDTLVYTKMMKDTASEGRIKPGNTVNVSGSATVPSPTQGKHLIAHIDSENNICESDETNNIVTRQIP